MFNKKNMKYFIILLFQIIRFTDDFSTQNTEILIPEKFIMKMIEHENKLIEKQLTILNECKFTSIILLQTNLANIKLRRDLTEIQRHLNNIYGYILSTEFFSSSQIQNSSFTYTDDQFLDFIKNSFRANKLFIDNILGEKDINTDFITHTFKASYKKNSSQIDINNYSDESIYVLLGNLESQIDLFGFIYNLFLTRIFLNYKNGVTNLIMVLDAKTDEVLLSSLENLLYLNFDYRILIKDIKSITNFNSEKVMFLEEKINFKNSLLDVSNLIKMNILIIIHSNRIRYITI